jgi:drug/metabolite transporter (DMT)-like permease
MLGVVALWSITPIFVKLLLQTFDPFTISFLRLAQGILVLLVAYRAGGRFVGFQLSRWHLIGGIGVSINYALFTLGLSFTTASAGVLMVQIQHVTLAALAALILGERLGSTRIFAILAVVAGAAYIAWAQGKTSSLLAPERTVGNLVMLASGVGWGLYAVSNKALSGRLPSLPIVLPMLTIGLVSTGGLALLNFELRRAPTLGAVAALIVLGAAATGGSFYLIAEGIRRLSAAFAGTITAVTPLIQLLLARRILGESLSADLLVGAALVVGGVLAIGMTERGRRPSSRDDGPPGRGRRSAAGS